ncbi:MAG TPA: prepilin-type N-terminal cleavage/methylation domain-containing protein [Xanthomonadales bacterium]|nr:prepilin-type N-terminal cleavage/methylation domain-containing protein [Xanthomonadales bacterium]
MTTPGAFSGFKIRKQNGMTLVELMIAVLLGVILVGGILLIHLSGRATFIDTERLSRIQENVRFASDYVIRDIRNAGFRDEAFLRAGHEQQIREAYAAVLNDGANIRVRYAGRGHCTEAFDEFRLVENEYGLDTQTGELTCRGRTVARDAGGDVLITDQDFSDPVGLVDGLTSIAFQLICPGGGTSCSCDLVSDLDNACTGVLVAMQFEGMRAMDASGDFEDRSVELTAAFRNVILDRINAEVAEL